VTASLASSFGLDPLIEADLRALGNKLNPEVIEKSRALYANRMDFTLPHGGSRDADVAYGAHARHRLDICRPAGDGHPIALFVPGGGFTGGDKAFFAHIPYFLARHGFVGIAMNYRLAPEFVWPSGAEDVSAALDWLAENGERFGGDTSRIFVIAQSAGAVHSAASLLDPRFRPKHYASIRAAALMSGLYKIYEGMGATNFEVYFGNDAAQYDDRSSANHVSSTKLPVVLTIAELDPYFFPPQIAALLEAFNARDGHCPQFAWLKGHNHLSPVLGMGGPGDTLGEAIVTELLKIGLVGPASPPG
jgi:acetyl esterase/lipase